MNKFFDPSSLRNRLTLTVVILIAVAVVVVGFSLNSTVTTTLNSIVRQEAEVTAQDMADWVSQQITFYQDQLRTAFTLTGASELSVVDMESLIAADSNVTGAFFKLPDAELTRGIPWPGLTAQPASELTAGVGEPLLHTDGTWQIPIWIPVLDETGNSTGVFGFLVSLTPWIEGLAEAVGEFTIINQDGEAVLSSDPGAIMQGDARRGVRHGAIGDALRESLLGKTGVTAFSIDGTDSLISYAPVAETGWGLTRLIPVKDAAYSQATSSRGLILVGIGCLLVMGTVVYIYSGSFVNPIRRLSDATSVLASGNLDQQVKVASNDEIGTLADNFNQMVQNLRQLVGGMGSAARELLTASESLAFNSQEAGYVTEQVSATIQEVATGAGRLAEDAGHGSNLVEDIAVLAERMLAQATKAGANSAQVKKMAQDALLIVDEQNRAVEQTVSAVDGAETTIRQLNAYSEEIGRIVEIIGDISGQTDLLALNAAVEAARAGEHGLGFAVVAEQVRVLAEQTDNSTKEIADLIRRVKLGTEKAVQEMNGSRQAAANAQSAVHHTATSFRNITEAIEQTDNEVASITAGLQTLQQHAQSVVQVIHNVSAVSTESAASAEEVTAASQEQTSQIMLISKAAADLSKLANQLQSAIGAFRLNG